MHPGKHYGTQQHDHHTWLKRMGLAGFLFFFFKGLAWLTVLFLLPYLGFQL